MLPHYRAQILDETVAADRDVLESLRSDHTVEFIDLRDRQRGWVAELLPPPSELLTEEPFRWVYLPWRRTVVGLLGPRAFRQVRLDRNRNKITSEEQVRLGALKIGVVGLSVGHAVAHTLALEGLCGELRLADFDVIELTNLNRIPGTILDLGVNKAVVVARRIAEIDPYLVTKVFENGFDEEMSDEFFDGLDIVVEECDSFDAKILVRVLARAKRIPVIMEASDRGMLDIERFDLEPERPIFHGLLGDIQVADAIGCTGQELIDLTARLVQIDELSPRMTASLPEIGVTLSTWPQLGGDVQLGGASVAAAVRRIGLGSPQASGRVRIDLPNMLDRVVEPELDVANSSV